ncbi:MAG: deoxyguanosinetriphosphate triphosphohydrolase [bacterium]|nr:deoxyguanosinetriphosphate triphosphohydrolase [bacterium]
MDILKELEKREELLHPKAAKSTNSSRRRTEKKSPVRTEYQRDRDRILHCKSFRRLKHKTQVFISPGGDHFRTRLTHTLEMSQIARTIAKALNLNEDLTEAIAMGHDLGHTPFGHTGERVLDELTNGFKHFLQSLRVADKLEYDGKGLNLTNAVRNGIVTHSKGKGSIIPDDKAKLPSTLEGQIVRIADIVAYVNHDIDDAVRAGLITQEDVPKSTLKLFGPTFARRIDTIVLDIIAQTNAVHLDFISISPCFYSELSGLRDFLFEHVYWVKESPEEVEKIRHILMYIYTHVKKNPEKFINPYPSEDTVERRIIDFIAGMTDRYALNLFKDICFPDYIG